MADHIGLYQLATSQAGYFTLEQARGAGFSDQLLQYHYKTGRLMREAEGVYRFRDYPEAYSDISIAWLSLKRRAGNALASHETALSLLNLCDLVPRAIDITIERENRKAAGDLIGVRVHTTSHWPSRSDIASRAGVEITGVCRTLVDCILWGTESGMIRQALQTAFSKRLITAEQLRKEMESRNKIGSRELVERALEESGVEKSVEGIIL